MLPQNSNAGSGGSKLPQYLAALAATFLTFCGAAQTGWSSPALLMLNNENSTLPIHLALNSSEASWVGSLLTIGGAVGAIPAGSIADCIGRKLTMLLLAVPIFVSWGLVYFAKSVQVLYGARFLGGVAFGAICAVVPMYVKEIAEDSVRGSLGTLFQIMMCCGITYTYAVGAVASYYSMAICCAVLPVLFVIIFAFAPETPSFLLKRNRRTEAERSLQKLRGRGANVSKELHVLESELNCDDSTAKISFWDAIGRRETKLAIVIALGTMACQQLTGINIVIFYVSTIFTDAQLDWNAQLLATFVGLAQLVAALISIVLIDRTGRKILLQISAVSMAICLAVLGFFFFFKDRGVDVSSYNIVPPCAVILYVLLFGIGFGPIPWLMSGEVLSDDVKGLCTSIATSLNWGLAFVTTKFFQLIVHQIGNANTYWLLAVISVVAFCFVTFVIIETKGKSIQQVQLELSGRKRVGNVI
ncbi:Sugar (and other) transporter [Nesidiocoris tenuis]|uniref:Sugar (And other) transporter n=1 Tax=Nesidiocoris tenuis TaxID=355587 RepID=A0ABN7AVD6_9HEMI|nr:Sugar (and other) transporter [Nesidiocoris tenuis]